MTTPVAGTARKDAYALSTAAAAQPSCGPKAAVRRGCIGGGSTEGTHQRILASRRATTRAPAAANPPRLADQTLALVTGRHTHRRYLGCFFKYIFFEEQSHFFHEIPLQKIFSVDPHTVHDLDRQLRRCTKRPLRPLSPYASPLLPPCPFSPPIILSLSPLLLPLSPGFHRVDERRLCRVRRPALCLVYPRRC